MVRARAFRCERTRFAILTLGSAQLLPCLVSTPLLLRRRLGRFMATSDAARSKALANLIGMRRWANRFGSDRRNGTIWMFAGKFRIFRIRPAFRGFRPRWGRRRLAG